MRRLIYPRGVPSVLAVLAILCLFRDGTDSFLGAGFFGSGADGLVWSAEGVSAEGGAIYLDEPDPEPPPTEVQRRNAEDKYTDGTMRVQREVIRLSNDRFVNDGTYREFYPDGQPFSEGSYKRGILNGQWKYWHDNGQLCKTIIFKDGVPDGSWEVFHKDGTRMSSKTYEKGLRQGNWVRYFEDGETMKTEESYTLGKLQGARTSYFPNGQKRQESHFKNSQLNGLMTEWDEAGNKVAEVLFVEGKINGKMVRWRADGTEIK
ncbi:MAG: toxin-antitoxin system YwqK family antitoxin [Pirellulales bacterium]